MYYCWFICARLVRLFYVPLVILCHMSRDIAYVAIITPIIISEALIFQLLSHDFVMPLKKQMKWNQVKWPVLALTITWVVIVQEQSFSIGSFNSSFYTGFRRKARVRKCNRFVAKRGVMVPGVPCVDRGNWGRETRHCSLVTEFGVLKVLASIAPYTFISHTKDVDLFPKGSVLELYSSKPAR